MKTKLALAMCAVVAVAGCATDPKKISAAYVSPTQYRSYDCDQIASESQHVERRSVELYNSMQKEANADKWQMGVGLLLFWPVLFALEGGDGPEAAEYSRLRGEYEALRSVSVEKKCDVQFREELGDAIKSQAKK